MHLSDYAIRAEGLSKRYRIGGQRQRYHTLRESLAQAVTSPFKRLLTMRRGEAANEMVWALRDASFDIQRGEVVGIIGRNGAGKSTLLKILSRVTAPTEGRVTVRGRVASLLEVGTGFHPELTGRENIFLNGAILGMTRAEVRSQFDEIVAFAEVERFVDTPVKHYSSGMYMRLAFAIAAHLETDILLVDEVLAVGDAEFQKKCVGKMNDVSRRDGRTVLFVSHNQYALRALCKHGIVLQNGRAVPKQDIASALARYSADRAVVLSYSWVRPAQSADAPTFIKSIDIRLEGVQPNLRLHCDCLVYVAQKSRPFIIAVDIKDANSFTIMQALPTLQPFIGGNPGLYVVSMEIDLPPLVPGIYGLDFWIGPHNMETIELIREPIWFEVQDSPTQGRTFPHTPDHGAIVPFSRATVRAVAASDTQSVADRPHQVTGT